MSFKTFKAKEKETISDSIPLSNEITCATCHPTLRKHKIGASKEIHRERVAQASLPRLGTDNPTRHYHASAIFRTLSCAT